MGVVDEVAQVVGGAETARSRIEARHVVAKRAIVWMLLNGHDLNGVVAVGSDARQHLGAELVVGAHPLLVLGHAYVALIYEQRRRVGLEARVLGPIGFVGTPHLRREYARLLVLHHARGIGRYALTHAAVPVHMQLKQLAMVHSSPGQLEFPVALGARLAVHLVVHAFLPVAEVAHQHNARGVGRPLAHHPAAVGRAVQAIIVVGVGPVAQTHFAASELINLVQRIGVAACNGRLKRGEPRVVLYDFES